MSSLVMVCASISKHAIMNGGKHGRELCLKTTINHLEENSGIKRNKTVLTLHVILSNKLSAF